MPSIFVQFCTDAAGEEFPDELETFWRISHANGVPLKLEDHKLAERYSQPAPFLLELQGLPRRPTEFAISAAVVVPMGEAREIFTSIPYRLIVREGIFSAHVLGLTHPGVLSGPELGTIRASCIAQGETDPT